MKKTVISLLLVMCAATAAYAETGTAPSPMKVTVKTVNVGNAVTGAQPFLVITDEAGRDMTISNLVKLTDKSGKAIKVNDLTVGAKLTVQGLVTGGWSVELDG